MQDLNLVIKADVAGSAADFLWATWTRFEPASDIYAADTTVYRHHLAYRAPVVIDARMKPNYPAELIVRPDIAELVDRRWREYFPQGEEWNAGTRTGHTRPQSVVVSTE